VKKAGSEPLLLRGELISEKTSPVGNIMGFNARTFKRGWRGGGGNVGGGEKRGSPPQEFGKCVKKKDDDMIKFFLNLTEGKS